MSQEEITPTPEVRDPSVEMTLTLPPTTIYRGTGRRKESLCTATLTLTPMGGAGRITINQRPYGDYMQQRQVLMDVIRAPLTFLQPVEPFDITLRVRGGGLVGQADAMLLAISRALAVARPSFRGPLRRKGYLTQDARSKERKKVGLKKARKSPQFSKR
jgi:small subunit ribosomal protein S9